MTIEVKTCEKGRIQDGLYVAARYAVFPFLVGVSDMSIVARNSFTSVDVAVEGFRYCFDPFNPARLRAFTAATDRATESFGPQERIAPVFLTLSRRLGTVNGELRLAFTAHGITTVAGKFPGYLLPDEQYVDKLVDDLYGALLPFAGGSDVSLPH
ncbi:hypothetical protein HY497_00500 [Candidatus Woesearchaeota archaeon]|nr:hypothetical protein [Candidatus Woesearchaeota archaeon]